MVLDRSVVDDFMVKHGKTVVHCAKLVDSVEGRGRVVVSLLDFLGNLKNTSW